MKRAPVRRPPGYQGGEVTFYHQTSREKAECILREGFVGEPNLPEDLAKEYGRRVELVVNLTSRPLTADDDDAPGDEATLAVSLVPSPDDFTGIVSADVGDPGRGGYTFWLLPPAVLNGRARVVRID